MPLIEADPTLCCLTNSANESPLFLATSKGFQRIARYILCESSICPSFERINGVTALHAAVTRRTKSTKDIVNTMLSKNPKMIKEVDALGWTPLHYAVFKGNLEATRLLMQCDSSAAYLLHRSGLLSALHVAAYVGRDCCCNGLDEFRSCVLKEDGSMYVFMSLHVLQIVCKIKNKHIKNLTGRAIVLEVMIRYRPDACDLLNAKGQTILHAAVLGGQINVVEFILQTNKLDGLINEADKDGNTPLHLAAAYPNLEIVELLASDRRVDKPAINKNFSKAADIFLGDNFERICLLQIYGLPSILLHYIFVDQDHDSPYISLFRMPSIVHFCSTWVFPATNRTDS
ncbi:unnamed protein product [Prunus armeniaca]